MSFRNSDSFLPLCWNTWLWQNSTTCICFHLQRNRLDTWSTSFPYRTTVFIFAAQYWGTHDLFAIPGNAWSPVLQYWSMHGCMFTWLYKLSFLNLYRIWRRLEAVASLLMMFEVYSNMMPCTDISEALRFQIPNSLRKVGGRHFFKMSATFHPSIRHRIPEGLTYGHTYSSSVLILLFNWAWSIHSRCTAARSFFTPFRRSHFPIPSSSYVPHERPLVAKGGTAVILPKCRLPCYILGIFYMPQIYDMERRAEDFYLPLKICRVWTRELGYQRPARYL